MKHRLFTVLSAVSLLLFGATLIAWAGSPWGYERSSQRHVTVGDGAYFLASSGHGLRIARQRVRVTGYPDATADAGRLGFWQIRAAGATVGASRFGPEEPAHGALGFGWGSARYSKGLRYYGTSHTLADGRPVPASRASTVFLDYRVWAVPYGFLLLGWGLFPALWLRAGHRAYRRRRLGQCLRCGYDLRESKDRCPECGEPVLSEPADEPGWT